MALIPAALATEHHELGDLLEKASAAGGRTGEAAREVARVLQPHILLEQEFATPPLTLLPRLASGEVTDDMARFISKTDSFKEVLPRMLDEHRLIVGALRVLMQAAAAERQPGFAQFAQKMILHAQMEEEILYPAAILVGEYIRLKLQ